MAGWQPFFCGWNQSADEYGDSPAGKYVDSFDDETTLSGIYFDEWVQRDDDGMFI